MTIKTKTENSVRYDLCEGVNGSGRQCWVVQVIRPGRGCVHQDMFLSLSEAENWFEYACG
jgi:hypothetical protein